MLGMSLLGTAHTLVGLIALSLGLGMSFASGRISIATSTGKLYSLLTAITCITGFGIFEHGGFGKPHMLGILTLITLAFAIVVESRHIFARNAVRISAVAYSATMLFHCIPGVTETSTRLPLGAPLLPNADAPELKFAYLGLFAIFLAAAIYQFRRLKPLRR